MIILLTILGILSVGGLTFIFIMLRKEHLQRKQIFKNIRKRKRTIKL